ncbi:MAG: serine/threonine-protein kinase, partial [Pseudomonadota bacterium]
MTEPPPSFARLDALLEELLELEEPDRPAFLAALTGAERDGLEALLQPFAGAGVRLADVAAQANLAVTRAVQTPDDGSRAGRWRLHRELGSGGMGQVFYATRVEPGVVEPQGAGAPAPAAGAPARVGDYQQQAAIKILWSQAADTEVRARFFRERRILATLDHSGLARFLDGGFLADGRPWFAMEYVPGVDVVTHAQTLPLRARIELLLDVCRTVSYAHERLIVHRDIKPQNVLVDSLGQPRLLDFGVAAVLAEVDDGVVTRTQGSPLTLQYASPEQVTGGLVSVASDVYQLGLLLYEVLTGRPPRNFADLSLSEAISVILEGDCPRPSRLNTAIATDLDAIIGMALATDQDQRYSSVSALGDDLKRFLAGQPVRAVGQSTWYVARRFIRRNAGIISVSAGLALSLSVATVVSVQLAREARAQAQRSDAAQQILVDVFQNADPFGESGANVSLAAALVKAQPTIERRVAADPELAFEVQKNLAEIYSSLGLVEAERRAYQAVIEVAPRLADRAAYAHLLGVAGVGGTHARTNPQQAARYFADHLPAQPASGDQVTLWLDAQYSYVGALNRLRQHDRAAAETQIMAAVIEDYAIDDPRIRGRLSQLLAGVARRAGDRNEEDRHWQAAVTYARAAENPAALAVMLNNRAIQLGRMGRFEASEQRFLEAIAIFEDAGHQGPTLANVLRSYAGLQFRDRRVEDAIRTSERALRLLDADSQVYARFVAEVNLAQYQFANDAPDRALAIVVSGLSSARDAFPRESGVPERMLRVFGKLLVFGGATELAAHALNLPAACPEAGVLAELEAMAAREEAKARQTLWNALADLGVAPREDAAFDQAIRLFQDDPPPFFDALDRWRFLRQLEALAVGSDYPLPSELIERQRKLDVLRSRFLEQVAAQRATLAAFAGYFHDLGARNETA